jgi:radical SAM protein with 4Fe4S-binding SPASM domain
VRLTAGGKGTFDAVAQGLARLRDAGIPHQLLAVVGPWSAPSLDRTVATALALGPEKVQLSIDYGAPWTEESLGALREGLRDAGDVWMAAFRAGKAVPLNPLHGKILAHLHGGMPCASRCLLAQGELTVAPSGNLYPCGQMVGEDDDDALVIGHVSTGVDAARVARLQSARDRIDDTCGDCELVDRCQSQCGCRHLALTGELGKITASLCETEAAFVEEADRVAETLHGEGCRAFLAYYYERSWAPAAGAKLVTLRRGPGDASRGAPLSWSSRRALSLPPATWM